MTIAAAGVVSNLAARTVHTIKSSDAVTTYSNKETTGSTGFHCTIEHELCHNFGRQRVDLATIRAI